MERFTLQISREFDVSGPLKLSARLANGRVQVQGYEGSLATVEVKLEVRADSRQEADEEAEHIADGIAFEGDTLTVESPPTDDTFWRRRRIVRIEYELRVPRQTEAEVGLANGPLRINDIAGPLRANLVNGPLLVSGLAAPVDAHVVNGPLQVSRCGSSLTASATNGPVHVERTGGPLDLKVTNGPIDVEDAEQSVQCVVLNGPITYRGAVGGSFDLTANNCSIILSLPEGSRFELDAEAEHGRVLSDFRVDESAAVPEDTRRLRLRTNHGNILLSELPQTAPAAV